MKLWILAISNIEGITSSIHLSEEAAKAARFSYVEDQWDTEMSDTEMPGSEEEAVAAYFEHAGIEEDAEITEFLLPLAIDDLRLLTETGKCVHGLDSQRSAILAAAERIEKFLEMVKEGA